MVDIFTFPKEEAQYFTRLGLRKYSRPRPGSKKTTDIMSYIRLPLPANLTDSFNMDVNQHSFDMLGMAVDNSLANLLAAGKEKTSQFIGELGSAYDTGNFSGISDIAMKTAAMMPAISDTGLGRFAQQQVGMIRNPHITNLFEGVKLKSYQFNWKLAPKSADEARMLNNLIDYIKAYMHPEIMQLGFSMEYPYIATLDFEVGNSTTSLPKVKDSFITRLDVNSAASGTPAFFNDGNPVTTEISMSFQEIDIQTRKDFRDRLRAHGDESKR